MADIDNNKKYLIIKALLGIYRKHEHEKEVYSSLEVIRDVAHSHRENGTHLSYDEAISKVRGNACERTSRSRMSKKWNSGQNSLFARIRLRSNRARAISVRTCTFPAFCRARIMKP